MNVYQELQWRGLVYDGTEGVEQHLLSGPVTAYIGFDPTAASLHVGSFIQILALARLQQAGHVPIALVGGGTGLIGDPSGKTQERQLLTAEKVEENCTGIRNQLARFLDFDVKTNPARLINNADWLTKVSFVDFLRDVGKHFTINYMLAKDSVKRRIEQEDGISYTEFSYMLMQSYDFLMLYDNEGCTLQVGGSDQWGNITAGAELIRKMRRKHAFGLVQPLITSSTGVKFGKTESGTIWLDPELTSPYRFYQFWLNTADDDVVRYLKFFTHLEHGVIDELAAGHDAAPQRREAHRRLAEEVTSMVHGEDARDRAVRSSEVLFGGDLGDLGAADILEIFDDVPSSRLAPGLFEGGGEDGGESGGMSLVDLLAETGLSVSKGAARRLVRDGGAYINNRRVGDEQEKVRRGDFLDDNVLVLRAGRKKYHVVTLGDPS